MRHTTLLTALVLGLAACSSSSSPTSPTPPPPTDLWGGTYAGNGTITAQSTVPVATETTAPAPVTITLGLRSDGDYDVSIVVTGGTGSTSLASINSAGVLSFPAFNSATALQTMSSLFTGLCTMTGAVVTPEGSIQGKTVTLQLLATGAICDWGAGTGTQDLRPTIITIQYQATRP